MNERWRPVPGREGFYEVSDRGRVKSATRRLADGRLWGERPLTLFPGTSGHIFVNLANPKQFRTVHVMVLEAFVGPRPEGMLALHWNDVPDDNRVENLRWGTYSENKQDEVRNGLHYQASKTHCPREHRLAAPNLVRSEAAKRHRRCLACDRARHYAIRHGVPFDPEIADLKYAEIIATGAKESA